MFKPAVKHEAKLRLAIAGPSGSGKTFTALTVATALGKTAVIDTEHGSASKYADIFSFDVLNLDPPFHPQRFVEAIRAAAKAGYEVVVIDSLSHAWNGPGGVLEIVDAASTRFKGNSYAGWQEGTPAHNSLIEAIVGAGVHVIGTMRSKQDYILVERNGRQTPQKVGMAPVQRDGMEYEFDIYLEMDMENNGIVQKTRCPQLTGKVIAKPGKPLADTLQDWLSGEPAPPQQPTGRKQRPEPRHVEFDDLEPAKPTNGQRAVEQSLKELDRKHDPDPLPDDEVVIAETPAKGFIAASAALLGLDEEQVKDVLKSNGVTGVPRDTAKRLAAYRQLRSGVQGVDILR